MAFDGEGYFAGEFDVELELVEEQVQLYLVSLEVEGRVGLPHAYNGNKLYKTYSWPCFFSQRIGFPSRSHYLDVFAILMMKIGKKIAYK